MKFLIFFFLVVSASAYRLNPATAEHGGATLDDGYSANVAAIIRPAPLPPRPDDLVSPDDLHKPAPIIELEDLHKPAPLPEQEDLHKPAPIPDNSHIITDAQGTPLVQIIINVNSPSTAPVVEMPVSTLPEVEAGEVLPEVEAGGVLPLPDEIAVLPLPDETPVGTFPIIPEEIPVGTLPLEPEEIPVGTFPLTPEEIPVGSFPLIPEEIPVGTFPLLEEETPVDVPDIAVRPVITWDRRAVL